jgi:hypothetical protein
MANVYVYSGAGGAGTGADWTNAYTTLVAAGAAKAAGDRFFVAHDHDENLGSALTVTLPGTVTAPNLVLCVNRAGSVPPVSADLRTTAILRTTGAFNVTVNGFAHVHGISVKSNSAAASGGGAISLSGAGSQVQRWDSCNFQALSTAATNIGFGAGTAMFWNNCTIRFGSASDTLNMTSACTFEWKNSTAIDGAGSVPNTLFSDPSRAGTIILEGVDLSALSSKTIFAATSFASKAYLQRCKLPATVTINGVPTGGIGKAEYTLINCDNGAVNYRNEKHAYNGDLTTETTVVRTGGASDGTTPVSHKIITTANSNFSFPFTCMALLSDWNDTVGSPVTVTVYGTWATGSSVPNKEDIWIDVEYQGSSASPVGSIATSGNADVLASAACDSDGSTWGGTPAGGGTPTPFKMVATFTPQMEGPFTVYVRCARASTNAFYIDPKVALS